MSNLNKNIVNKESGFIEGKHYKYFIVNDFLQKEVKENKEY